MTKSTKYVILFYKNEYKIKEDIYILASASVLYFMTHLRPKLK